jgi:hypothetical protein
MYMYYQGMIILEEESSVKASQAISIDLTSGKLRPLKKQSTQRDGSPNRFDLNAIRAITFVFLTML